MEKEKTKIPAISSVLEGVLDPVLYDKYKKRLNLSVNADYLYQWALISLNESNSDKAISFLIAALDLDRKHSPSLHLLKSMVIGLSKDFYENGGSAYKQKYDNLDNFRESIRKKAISLKKKNEKLRLEIDILERELNEGMFIVKFFKKLKREKELLALKNKMVESMDRLDNYKKEINKIKKIQKNEEYSKILGTILEICVLPKRFNYTEKT